MTGYAIKKGQKQLLFNLDFKEEHVCAPFEPLRSLSHTAMAVTSLVYYTGFSIPINWEQLQSISAALFTQQVPMGSTQTTAITGSVDHCLAKSDCSNYDMTPALHIQFISSYSGVSP